MQYLSDDVLVTGGSQTAFSYRTIFTCLPVADATWMGAIPFALGVAKLGLEVLVVDFAHLDLISSAKSFARLGFSFSLKPINVGFPLFVSDVSSFGEAVSCRTVAHVDSVASAFGLSCFGLATSVLDFSHVDAPFSSQNAA